MAAKPYQIDTKDGVIFINLNKDAVIPPQYLIEVIDEMNRLYDVKSFNALWDFRGALPSSDFGYDAMERIIRFIDNHPKVQWNPYIAFLVDEGVQYGLSRMFQTLADAFPSEVQIFHNKTEAMQWITAKTAAGIINSETSAGLREDR